MSDLQVVGLNPQARASNWLAAHLGRAITQAFHELIENRHLYQSVNVESALPEQWNALLHDLADSDRPQYESKPRTLLFEAAWVSSFGQQDVLQLVAMNDGLHFEPPDVRLFCDTCGERTAFQALENHRFSEVPPDRSARQFGVGGYERPPHERPIVLRSVQHFGISYACAYCKARDGALVVLVRRARSKLTLCGRAPLAEVNAPAFVPKAEEKLYRDALIAYETGHVLPALFMLRVFIEQFARRVTGITTTNTRGDEIFASYRKTLPAKYARGMPSLGESYSKLSVALHSADADSSLFESARRSIEKHFEQRKANGLTEPADATKIPSASQESRRTKNQSPAGRASGKVTRGRGTTQRN